ncbi:invasion associated locus B family protein [Ancylobacter vacuolatus]|uniref:Invasion protein IalB n=1 Tax=Ancylobacter vacuolatus TaxID=223389 RepID=A0ABU0DLA2_9HYPH|nr:invasion associated locus B family protein [Ancylobacter vacuolatus]MDQ0349207.1 invasion protein IalB [Ancylobacter vacuolatus]
MHASLNFVGAALLAGVLVGGPAQAQTPTATAPVTQPVQPRPAAPAAVRPAPAAAAADPSQPAETTATYQDWQMRCVTPADQPRACEVIQKLQVQGQGLVATIAVGRADPKSPMLIVIQVPQGVWLPSGITLKVGANGKPLPLEYKRCAQVCVAEATLDAATVQSMKTAAEAGSFIFQDGAQRDVALPVSFKGFAPALDASLKP